jgi:hypothetical protein
MILLTSGNQKVGNQILMSKKKFEAKDVAPFNVGMALQHLEQATDELNWASVGFKPSERNHLARLVTRMALLFRKQPDNKEITIEYNRLLDEYEKKFAWIDRVDN